MRILVHYENKIKLVPDFYETFSLTDLKNKRSSFTVFL